MTLKHLYTVATGIATVGVALMKRISYMPSGASSGSVTATALPVANSADWIVVLYKYIAMIIKKLCPPRNRERGLSRRHIRRDNLLVTDSPHILVG